MDRAQGPGSHCGIHMSESKTTFRNKHLLTFFNFPSFKKIKNDYM